MSAKQTPPRLRGRSCTAGEPTLDTSIVSPAAGLVNLRVEIGRILDGIESRLRKNVPASEIVSWVRGILRNMDARLRKEGGKP